MTQEPDSSLDMNRRNFLGIAIAVLNGIIALVLAIPGLGFLLTPVFRKGQEEWIRVGSMNQFQAGMPQKAVFKYISENGYSREEQTGFVWVLLSDPARDPVVLSATCTHMGCNVAWNTAEKKFKCPCHGGEYNLQGQVIAGPPPRPLQKLQVKVENDQLWVKITT
ncbi:MAG: ubiquinol-cytochrome c reductase iron-sulfur subunit [Calditrichaeota bacterium]|nr:MAG: ubiquinol-cytochrome c reductase iron-sulfur subunit [Calditrichota bacterium]